MKKKDVPSVSGWGGLGNRKAKARALKPPDPSHVDRISNKIKKLQEEGDPGKGTATYATSINLSLSQSAKGKHNTGKRKAVTRMLERVCDKLDNPTLDAILASLRNSDCMAELYHDITDSIDVHDIEVRHEEKKVHYSVRGSKESKSISFKTIKNRLPALRKGGYYPD